MVEGAEAEGYTVVTIVLVYTDSHNTMNSGIAATPTQIRGLCIQS
jgi:hypothetical protein